MAILSTFLHPIDTKSLLGLRAPDLICTWQLLKMTKTTQKSLTSYTAQVIKPSRQSVDTKYTGE